jgi:hypothetical protein
VENRKKHKLVKFKTLKEQYFDLVLKKILICQDDLTPKEKEIIEIGYELIVEKLEDIKILNETIQRLQIENSNLKSYNDNKNY